MAMNKLTTLEEYAQEFEGVSIHGKRIRISFYYRGVRCFEALKGIIPSKNNIKFASNKRTVILHEIATNKFNYANHFSGSKKARIFSGQCSTIPTINEALDAWLLIKEKETAHSTYVSYKSNVKCHIRPKWGDRKLDVIKQTEIKIWTTVDLANLRNKTINEILIPLRGIFNDAFNDRIIDHNPLNFVDNKPVITSEPDPFTKEEIKLISATPTHRVQEVNAFIFNCWSGLRSSELLALAWEDVDIIKWRIKINRASVKGKYKETKNNGSTRWIELLDPAIDILKAQMQHSYMAASTEIKVLQRDNKTLKKESVKIVFLNSNNFKAHANEGTFRDRFFSSHLRKAKVRYRGPSQARHTFASQLLTAGVNERWIATQMGHTSIKMIEKRYGKWMTEEVPDMSKRVSNLIDVSYDRSNSDPNKKANQLN